jgi:hypothetical protein
MEIRAPRIVLTVLLGSATVLGAQEVELVTDRPDQTESTAIVPRGHAQLELGATYEHEDELGLRAERWQLPGSLLRIGMNERLELRLGWDGWLDEELRFGGERASESGFGDASFGAKLKLRRGEGTSPAIALIAATTVPVGEDPFSSDRFDPAARLTVSHDFSSGIGLGWNVGVETATEETDGGAHTTLSTAVYTLAAGFPAGERWGLFAEVFGDIPMSAEGGPAHTLDGGATYLLRPNLQLDAAAGVGLSDDAPDWFAGVGVSMRWPR